MVLLHEDVEGKHPSLVTVQMPADTKVVSKMLIAVSCMEGVSLAYTSCELVPVAFGV